MCWLLLDSLYLGVVHALHRHGSSLNCGAHRSSSVHVAALGSGPPECAKQELLLVHYYVITTGAPCASGAATV